LIRNSRSSKKRADTGDSESALLVKLINKDIERLKYSYKTGKNMPKERIPKEYVVKYGVENLWKLNLSSFWRMIYTVRGSKVEVISILLEVLDHKKYGRKFGYKTS